MRKLILSLLVLTSICYLSVSFQGCAKKKKGIVSEGMGTGIAGDDLQASALRGEDIPLGEQPDMGNFIEPNDPLVFADVLFDYDKSDIGSEGRSTLEKIANWLNGHDHVQLMIEGHCDERGSNEYNLALGEQRALSVRRYLTGLGISTDRLHTVSYGEEKPLDPSHNEDAWSKNRRAHFLVSAQ